MKTTSFFTLLLSAIFSICTYTISGQDYEFKNYDFDNGEIAVPESFKNKSEIILLLSRKIELNTDDTPFQYVLTHIKTLVNSESAIDANNKVYLPFDLEEYFLVNKVRVINPDGKIIIMNNDDILTGENQEEGYKYKYFAIKGLQIGSIIERITIMKEDPALDGVLINTQGKIPIVNYSFELIYPDHLDFASKSYNGLFDAIKKENKYEGKSALIVSDKNIAALPEEELYYNEARNKRYFRYKLDKNYNFNTQNIVNFKDFATGVIDNINKPLNDNQEIAINQLIEKIGKKNNEKLQIRAIEDYIKRNIAVNKEYNRNQSFTDAINRKQATRVDIIKLYQAIFNQMKIQSEVLFTENRFEKIFDDKFESYDQLSDLLFYFPKSNIYMEPEAFILRTPFINYHYTNNKGLYIKSVDLNGVKTPEIVVKDIPFVISKSENIMDIHVDFTKDITKPIVTSKLTFTGYDASDLQPLADFMTNEQYEEFKKDIAKSYSIDVEHYKVVISNDSISNLGIKPFIIDMQYSAEILTQKAGDKILFQVGELIGKQMEMYQKENLNFPIETFYPKIYDRTISITLPEGYRILNLNDAKSQFTLKMKNNTAAQFKTEVSKTQKNTYVIHNIEEYNAIFYPKEKFNDYKRIINAAADFNKIMLVIQNK